MSIKLVLGRSRQIVMLAALAVGFALFVAPAATTTTRAAVAAATAASPARPASRRPPSAAWATARRPPASRSSSVRSTPSSPAPTSPRSPRRPRRTSCVNDNGGINGRPVELVQETEQTDPAQAAAAAKKLVETEKVAGIVGNTSIIECAVNHKYYEANGYYVIGSGISPECYGTPNYAAVNMGPRHSVTGATQYLIREGVKKLVLIQSKVPGTEYIEGGLALAKQEGIPTESLAEAVPIQDANSVALKVVQAAGDNGGVVLTPPEALKILQAAAQGLQDRVKGLLHAVQHRLPGRCAGDDVRRQAGRQRGDVAGQHRRARHQPLQEGSEGLRA